MFDNAYLMDRLLSGILTLPAILIGLTFHEFAHAYWANKFGDPTPERQGRLTLNPFAHIDLWGLLMFLFAGFGWAKPVQTSPSHYQGDIRKKDIIVSAAGPFANLFVAVVFAAMIWLFNMMVIEDALNSLNTSILYIILYRIVWINCILFIFNLIPIPPLDGFHILSNLLPYHVFRFVYTAEKYGYIILMIFILSPFSDLIIGNGASAIYGAIMSLLKLT
ncbi:peptidase family M50 [Oxobacter pfennigii]|uniref:Peptidase family M50 n=1 Tax=Oxobacter pfennigii TaxID=36849 RepID=A0A0P8W4V0_9CLOT|nr:site-2 protease family protein [Oxobacter pfennigii]KPU42846.1 peptidase family M50 [Oxobacter pfennigii]